MRQNAGCCLLEELHNLANVLVDIADRVRRDLVRWPAAAVFNSLCLKCCEVDKADEIASSDED